MTNMQVVSITSPYGFMSCQMNCQLRMDISSFQEKTPQKIQNTPKEFSLDKTQHKHTQQSLRPGQISSPFSGELVTETELSIHNLKYHFCLPFLTQDKSSNISEIFEYKLKICSTVFNP